MPPPGQPRRRPPTLRWFVYTYINGGTLHKKKQNKKPFRKFTKSYYFIPQITKQKNKTEIIRRFTKPPFAAGLPHQQRKAAMQWQSTQEYIWHDTHVPGMLSVIRGIHYQVWYIKHDTSLFALFSFDMPRSHDLDECPKNRWKTREGRGATAATTFTTGTSPVYICARLCSRLGTDKQIPGTYNTRWTLFRIYDNRGRRVTLGGSTLLGHADSRAQHSGYMVDAYV